MHFVVVEKDTGEILLDYKSEQIEWFQGGYQERDKYDHLPFPKHLDLETSYFDVANRKFSVDEKKYAEKLALQRANLKANKSHYLLKTDWTQANLRDSTLSEKEIESYAKYRQYVRSIKLDKTVKSLPKIMEYAEWLDSDEALR